MRARGLSEPFAPPFQCLCPSLPLLLPLRSSVSFHPSLLVLMPLPLAGLQAAAGVEVIGEVTASNLSYHASFTQPHTADPTGHAAGGGGNLDGVLNFPAYYRAPPPP